MKGSRWHERWSTVFWGILVGIGAVLLLLAAAGRPAAAMVPGGGGESGRPAGRSVTPATRAGVQSYRPAGGISLGPGIGARPADVAADPQGPWAYVANAGSGDVSVLSGTTAVANVFVGGAPYLVRVSPVDGRAYIAGAVDGQLLLLEQTAVVGSVDVGGNPAAMAFHPTTGYAYLAFPEEDAVAVLSGTEILARLPVVGEPSVLAVDPLRPRVYVGCAQSGRLTILSGTAVLTDVVVGAPAEAIAVATPTGWAYVVAGDQVVVLSGTAPIAAIPAWEPVDLAFNPTNGYVYLSRWQQRLAVISGTAIVGEAGSYAGGHVVVGKSGLIYATDAPEHSGTVQVVRVTETIGIFSNAADVLVASPVTDLVYATSRWFLGNGEVAAFDPLTPTIIGPAPQIVQVAVHPTNGHVYLGAWQYQEAVHERGGSSPRNRPALPPAPPDAASPEAAVGQVFVLSGTELLGPIEVGPTLWDMAVHPQTGLVYVSLGPSGVAILDGAVLTATIPVEGCASQIAVQPRSGLVYVSDHCLGRLYVIAGTELVETLPLSYNSLGYLLSANPANGYVYVAALYGSDVTVVDGTHKVREFSLCPSPENCISWGMDSASDTGLTYVADESHDRLWVISGTAVYTTVTMPAPQWVQAHPSNGLLYVTTEQELVILRGLDLLATIPVTGTHQMAAGPQRSYMFSSGPGPGEVLVLIGTRLVQRLDTGNRGDLSEFAADPASGRLYMSTNGSGLLILEESLPYRFFLHLIEVGPRVAGGRPGAGATMAVAP